MIYLDGMNKIRGMYMGKRNKKITTATLFIFFILFTFMTGCIKDGTPKNISENEIYPKGDISSAKVFDTSHNEKAVSLNEEDIEHMLQTLKNSKKDLVTEYDSGLLELNITFTDSVIQLVRKDDETIYYVFHNNKINGICYKINSKDLSDFISKVSS
jgi:hypothetical protein